MVVPPLTKVVVIVVGVVVEAPSLTKVVVFPMVVIVVGVVAEAPPLTVVVSVGPHLA